MAAFGYTPDWITGGTGDSSNATPYDIEKNLKEQQYGYGLGGGEFTNPTLNTPSQVRPDESIGSRLVEQRGNYLYGGTVNGADQAIAEARTNMSPFTQGLGNISTNLQGISNKMGGQADITQGMAAQLFDAGLNGPERVAPINQGAVAGTTGALQHQGGIAAELADLANQPYVSEARPQLVQTTNEAMRQQLALAGSGRGMAGSAAAYRNAASQQALIQGQANAAAATMRAQEQNMWNTQRAGMLGQAAGIYGSQAQGNLALGGYTTGAEQQQMGLNDTRMLGLTGQALTGMGVAGNIEQGAGTVMQGAGQTLQGAGQLQLGTEALGHDIRMGQLQGNMGYEQGLNQIYGIDQGVGVQQPQEPDYVPALIGGAASLLSTAIGQSGNSTTDPSRPSDIRVKKDINAKPEAGEGMLSMMPKVDYNMDTWTPDQAAGQPSIPHYMDLGEDNPVIARDMSDRYAPGGLPPPGASAQAVMQAPGYAYNYRDPDKYGAGQFWGPMAQDLEKTPVGASTVMQKPDGTKAIDTGRLSLVNTSALANQQQQIHELSQQLDTLLKKYKKPEEEPLPAGARYVDLGEDNPVIARSAY